MALLGDIQTDVHEIRRLLEEGMAKKKRPRMTAEEHAKRAETQRMVRERIAYHEAKAKEQEAARGRPE